MVHQRGSKPRNKPRWCTIGTRCREEQLAQAGPAGVSISAIGHRLGVSGPALYRYFKYRLLFGPPLPGCDAHREQLVSASRAGMRLLLGVLGEEPPTDTPAELLASQLAAWAGAYQPGR